MSNHTDAYAEIDKQPHFLGHPAGLFVLFFTEMWERFSYYGMRGILTLYIAASATAADPGLGWTTKDALWLYGWYTMLVYVMSIPGGYIADKFLGQKKTVYLGGLLLCAGHGVLAIPDKTAFFIGLGLIILGVGCLKPNISTMVGGLYRPGDPRRDSGFTIFYIGINIGAFLASIVVGLVAHEYGWHYGFGLAGIGMLLGQGVYMYGQRYLTHVGNFAGASEDPEVIAAMKRPLTKIEWDRIIVLLISFLIIIVFWAAFEQAGGLMNLYTDAKVNRVIPLIDYTVPAAVFQSLNAGYIILFGALVGAFWIRRAKAGKEASSLFKMALGTIIMGLGFVFMMFASKEASAEAYGKAAMYWIFLAYFFHTIGELCASPVSLSFITKLAPVKYASIMMGVYFAATGFGNKLAGTIGESSQLEPFKGDLIANVETVNGLTGTVEEGEGDAKTAIYPIAEDKNFSFKTSVSTENGQLVFTDMESGEVLNPIFKLDAEATARLEEDFKIVAETHPTPLHAKLLFEKDEEAVKVEANKGDGKDYSVSFVLEEQQSDQEFNTFMMITILTVAFGLLLIVFLKKLKALTHGAEDVKEEEESLT
ncbi:peptide MFS transporter [Pontibacter sp. G13]|uniref:peptide MFS transporter n=1 Tax=Pontibacter sp. G13 TaxID=3074898 RepID=UPI00288C50F5|nr:peptide MFS transporter [Pontibacter sp. G13]WNJ21166.1 peptide MFS transporter [Pontibacter sp. G13]